MPRFYNYVGSAPLLSLQTATLQPQLNKGEIKDAKSSTATWLVVGSLAAVAYFTLIKK